MCVVIKAELTESRGERIEQRTGEGREESDGYGRSGMGREKRLERGQGTRRDIGRREGGAVDL